MRSLSHFCVTGLTSASNFTASTRPVCEPFAPNADAVATSDTSTARTVVRFTVVRIPPGSLPEQERSGTVEKGVVFVKRLLIAAALLLASAGVAQAAPVRMVVRDVPLRGAARVLAGSTPRFNLVGLHWQGRGTPWFRTRSA